MDKVFSERKSYTRMGKSSKRLVFGAASVTIVLTIHFISAQYPISLLGSLSSWKLQDGLAGESLKVLLGRLVSGEERALLNETGFACHSDLHTQFCLTSNPVYLDTKTLTVYSPSYDTTDTTNYTIQPYPRKEDETAMKAVSSVHILQGNMKPPPVCNYIHRVPALIFSSGGFTGNIFHEFNELVIPLFLTCRHFQSRVKFVITDFKPSWVRKYNSILTHLSRYNLINPAENASVHCFPGAIIGLQYHDNLAINSTDLPQGHSIFEFRQFLKQSYNLKIQDVSEIENPTILFLSRHGSRRFLNEHELVKMMEDMGFRVVITRGEKMSNLDEFAQVVNTCSVMVGVHGAGFTNAVFLPAGAVVVQVVPLGLDWAATTYYGETSTNMELNYVEYKIKANESSLFYKYGKDDPVIADPQSIFLKGYRAARAVYIDGQSIKVDVPRFRDTFVRAVKLLNR